MPCCAAAFDRDVYRIEIGEDNAIRTHSLQALHVRGVKVKGRCHEEVVLRAVKTPACSGGESGGVDVVGEEHEERS